VSAEKKNRKQKSSRSETFIFFLKQWSLPSSPRKGVYRKREECLRYRRRGGGGGGGGGEKHEKNSNDNKKKQERRDEKKKKELPYARVIVEAHTAPSSVFCCNSLPPPGRRRKPRRRGWWGSPCLLPLCASLPGHNVFALLFFSFVTFPLLCGFSFISEAS
jgi:hypothetical protein